MLKRDTAHGSLAPANIATKAFIPTIALTAIPADRFITDGFHLTTLTAGHVLVALTTARLIAVRDTTQATEAITAVGTAGIMVTTEVMAAHPVSHSHSVVAAVDKLSATRLI